MGSSSEWNTARHTCARCLRSGMAWPPCCPGYSGRVEGGSISTTPGDKQRLCGEPCRVLGRTAGVVLLTSTAWSTSTSTIGTYGDCQEWEAAVIILRGSLDSQKTFLAFLPDSSGRSTQAAFRAERCAGLRGTPGNGTARMRATLVLLHGSDTRRCTSDSRRPLWQTTGSISIVEIPAPYERVACPSGLSRAFFSVAGG